MEEIKVIENLDCASEKPIAFSGKEFPLNDLSDREFEELLYSIFNRKIQTNEFVNEFDNISLMQGISEQGRDNTLILNGKKVGLIQCKKYKTNINKTQFAKEILKFGLYCIKNKELMPDVNSFVYYIAASNGFSGNTIDLIDSFNESFILEPKLKDWTNELLTEYVSFNGFSYDSVKIELETIFRSIKVRKIFPTDINIWLVDYEDISKRFFEIRSVTDNKLINKLLETITTDDNAIINTFITNYKKSAIEKLSPVNFFGIALNKHRDRPRDIDLTSLFVKPLFSDNRVKRGKDNLIHLSFKTKLESERQGISISKIFTEVDDNLIILGDPGSGKSILVKYLILSILQNEISESGLNKYKDYIPIRIELRKFIEKKQKNHCTIIGYLSILLKKEYQLEISEDLLNKFISSRKTLFFFDGLDEIFDLNSKIEVRDDIQIFSSLFSNCKTIITSRFIGYHDIKFNSKKFKEYAIKDFNDTQIQELISRFFTTQIVNIPKREKTIKDCANQITSIDNELKSNPLILTLIIILVKNNLDIPESKLEIYEACTNTLVEKRDIEEKELEVKLPIKNMNRVFASLAFWQNRTVSDKKAITYKNAQKQIADYLIEKNEFTEFEDAEKAAEKFLEYAERRSIYFENNFTHKTFLEYYSAYFIYIKYETKGNFQGRDDIITKYIENAFWHVVFELLLSMIDRYQEDNEVIDNIITTQLSNNSNNPNLLYFLIDNIKRIKNISNEIKEFVIERTFKFCLSDKDLASMNYRKSKSIFLDDNLYSLLGEMLQIENLNILFRNVILNLDQQFKDDAELSNLYILIYEIQLYQKRYKGITIFSYISEIANHQRLLKVSRHLFILNALSPQSDVKIIDKIKEHFIYFGHNIFESNTLIYLKNIRITGIFGMYLTKLLRNNDSESIGVDYPIFEENGLDYEVLIDKIEMNRYFYRLGDDNFKSIITYFLKVEDIKIQKILEAILKKADFQEKVYREIKQTNTSSNNVKFSILDKIFEKKKMIL